tara:strand:+ start:1927 stop:2349 length:423 start_codon:yes stop_codon:yes gene_type:complete
MLHQTKSKLSKVTNQAQVKIKDDPVRDVSYRFRTTQGRNIYTIQDKAVVCIANTFELPITMQELEMYSQENAKEFTIFYTVWSYEKGYGRTILNKLLQILQTERFVTLSPKTEMAKKFHLRNGAKLLSNNKTSYNFEYFK